MDPVLSSLGARLAAIGLLLRGGFHPEPGEAPALRDGSPAGTILLVGNAGSAMWQQFRHARELADGAPNPLDRWSHREIGKVAEACGAEARFPSDRPHLPFQRWAMRAEPLARSPLGLLIHPVYGLWHAYRGALLFREGLALDPPQPAPSPCDSCPDRPCLTACPVGAFTAEGYGVASCRSFLAAAEGGDCFPAGCRSRAACPVGTAWRYLPEHAAFHLRAFSRG